MPGTTMRWGAAFLMMGLMSGLGGCGRKGPLYLPGKPVTAPPTATRPAPAVPATAPQRP